MMQAIGVIPARWGSTRFLGKPLALLNGRPMIEHVYRRARQCRSLNDCIIACDDQRIFQAAQNFGAKVILTSPQHPSGSDRIAEVVKNLSVKVVVNIQGDEPFIAPKVIDQLTLSLLNDSKAVMATMIKRIVNQEEFVNPNIVKVVIDLKGNALYFSRSPIPFSREGKSVAELVCYKHLGLYAYRKDFLLKFTQLPFSKLENIEKLEQLRVLEAGYQIKTIETDIETIGIDTPEDLKRAQRYFQKETAHA